MTIDIQVLHGNNQPQPTQLYYAIDINGVVNETGVEGSAKVAQKFATLFLSDYDSIRKRGTGFVPAMRAGRIRTDASVVTNFTAAVLAITQQLGDQSALPASERLVGASLLAHSIFGDTLSLTIQVLTANGSLNFVLPLKQVS
jgi:hypothetical protein